MVIPAGNGAGASAFLVIGNFRIVRNSGYEYRTKSTASHLVNEFLLPQELVARFTDEWDAVCAVEAMTNCAVCNNS